MRDERIKKAIDANLSGLTYNELQRARLVQNAMEEKPVMKKKLSAGLALAIVLVLLGGAALAVGLGTGLTWYYNNRFSAYRQFEPDKYEAIMNSLNDTVPQEEETDELIQIAVQDVAWVPEYDMLTLTLRALSTDPERFELHPYINLDTDGNYMDPNDPDADEDAHGEHYLWSEKGFGPVREMMDDPNKELLLIKVSGCGIEGMESVSAEDYVRLADGSVLIYVECGLSWRHETFDAEQRKLAALYPEYREYYEQCIVEAQNARKALQDHPDTVEADLRYSRFPFIDNDDRALYASEVAEENQRTVHFSVKIER